MKVNQGVEPSKTMNWRSTREGRKSSRNAWRAKRGEGEKIQGEEAGIQRRVRATLRGINMCNTTVKEGVHG